MRPRSEVLDIIGRADLQVVCSEWFEGFPLVIVEAYARGTPVIASRIGSLEEIVEDGAAGFPLPAWGRRPRSSDRVRRLRDESTLRQRLRAGARAQIRGALHARGQPAVSCSRSTGSWCPIWRCAPSRR